jgi:hypothetical protein
MYTACSVVRALPSNPHTTVSQQLTIHPTVLPWHCLYFLLVLPACTASVRPLTSASRHRPPLQQPLSTATVLPWHSLYCLHVLPACTACLKCLCQASHKCSLAQTTFTATPNGPNCTALALTVLLVLPACTACTTALHRQASLKRKLAQTPATFTATPNGPNPFTGIANAFRFIFSNTFDWFRARGGC